jgi:hypothetical protein
VLKLVAKVVMLVNGVLGKHSLLLSCIKLRVVVINESFSEVFKRMDRAAEKAATNKAKASGNKEGKQFVKQPKAIAKKVSKFR